MLYKDTVSYNEGLILVKIVFNIISEDNFISLVEEEKEK